MNTTEPLNLRFQMMLDQQSPHVYVTSAPGWHRVSSQYNSELLAGCQDLALEGKEGDVCSVLGLGDQSPEANY